jgi:carbonic anhydrase
MVFVYKKHMTNSLENILTNTNSPDKNIIEQILDLHKGLPTSDSIIVPEHEPEILLIGCIDARLDVFTDIGLPRGKALIVRNIAAVIAGINDAGKSRSTEAAAIEFAIIGQKIKHIIVMGHTHCGGIKACVHGHNLPEVQRYLAPLESTLDMVRNQGGSLEEQARSMEEAAVSLSINNLQTYPIVQKALADGQISLHGWVIDIVTKRLKIMNDKGKFAFI